MVREKPTMPYIFGEPEGLGRRESEEEREERERLTKEDPRILRGRKRSFTHGIEEVSLNDIPEEEIATEDSIFADEEAWGG